MNILFDYVYRDAANNKRSGEAVFTNPRRHSPEEVLRRFAEVTAPWRLLPDMLHFQPEAVGLPTLYFEDAGYELNLDDIDLHECRTIDDTTAVPTDPRTVDQFLADVVAVGSYQTSASVA